MSLKGSSAQIIYVLPAPLRRMHSQLSVLGCKGAWAPTRATRRRLISHDLTLAESLAGSGSVCEISDSQLGVR